MINTFNRQEAKKWEKLDESNYLDYKTQLGKGSYGVVYRGYNTKKDSLIAIKIVKNSSLTNRQIETLVALSSLDHPNIMGFYGQIVKQNNTFLLLQFCSHGTLADLISRKIQQQQVLKLFRQIVQGMCYMNAKEKMHRDFKPQNILIGLQNDIKISDFGLAQTTNSIFVTGKRGTPIYSAPEVFLIYQKYSYNCDVWSAGLILYEMLVGQKLFKHVKDYDELKNEWLSYERGLKQATIPNNFHPLWQYFLNYMLQFDATKRPTFHLLLQKIKLVYSNMRQDIIHKTKVIQKFNFTEANNYIIFNIKKYQLLLDLCQKFTSEDIRINGQFKYSAMFMSLLRYTLFAKEFIRNLRYKRIIFDGKDLLGASEAPQIEMLLDKYRFGVEHKLVFYSDQIKNNIITRIKNVYCKRNQSREIIKELKQIIELVEKYAKDEPIENHHEELSAIFQTMLPSMKKKIKNFKKKFTFPQRKLYAFLLFVMFIDKKFPESDYESINIELEANIYEKSEDQLNNFIETIYDQDCK